MFIQPELRPVVISVYEPAMIQPDEVTHDLGEIPTDSHVEHTFYLYNVGGKPLILRKADASCGCTVVKLEKKTLLPGESTALKVNLDTSLKIGRVKKTISVYSNDIKNPKLSLFLVGKVLPNTQGHGKIIVKDPQVLFHGECATCHVLKGKGKTGKALFQADCAMCHGLNAQGSVAPSLLKGDYENIKFKDYIRKIIAEGSPRNPEMAGFSKEKGGPLTEADIDSLVNFLAFQASQSQQGLLDAEGNAKITEDEE
jgi:mono/diheme cytochrome c family protein